MSLPKWILKETLEEKMDYWTDETTIMHDKPTSNQRGACTYILNDHHQKRQLYAKVFLFFRFHFAAFRIIWVRACDVCRANIRAGDLENTWLDVIVCESLDMSVLYSFAPNLQRFRSASEYTRILSFLECLHSNILRKNTTQESHTNNKKSLVILANTSIHIANTITRSSREWIEIRTGKYSWTYCQALQVRRCCK